MALPSPMVDPPPIAITQSAFVSFTWAIAAAVTETGVAQSLPEQGPSKVLLLSSCRSPKVTLTNGNSAKMIG